MHEKGFIGITSSFKVSRPPSDVVVILKKAKKNLAFEGKTWFYLMIDDFAIE